MSEILKNTPSIHTEEYLDLVDEQDNIVGNKKRSEIYAENLSNYRVINAFLVNSKGELWIPRRTSTRNYILYVWM